MAQPVPLRKADASGKAPAGRLLRWGYTALGVLMVALGVIGALLPVMPTTIFLILALACFSRASPQLEHWLLNHPRFGAPLRQWREHRAVSRRGKRMACFGMALGFALMCAGRPPWWVVLLVAVLELAVLAYLLRRPEGPLDAAAPAAAAPRLDVRPLIAGIVIAAHGALLAWALYGHAATLHVVAAEPLAAQAPLLIYVPAAAPPAPLELQQAERVSAAAAPAPERARRETPPLPQAAAPKMEAPPLPPLAEAPPAGAPAPAMPRAAAPADTASVAAAPPAPALPPAPQEVRSGSNSWEGKVLARMERFRRYPAAARARGEEGIVTLRCRVDREGRVLAAAVEHSSGHPALDQAALDTLQRAAPLPRIPDERPEQLELSIPVQFRVRQPGV